MTLLATLAPLIRADTQAIQFTLSRTDSGQLQALLVPKLGQSPEEETDAAIATLKAALARPLRFDIPGDADPDSYVAEALAGVSTARGGVESDLSAYLASIEAAKKAAQEAQASKAAASKAKGAKPATPAKVATKAGAASAASSETNEGDEGDDEADDGVTETPSAVTTAGTASSPAPAPVSGLFDFD